MDIALFSPSSLFAGPDSDDDGAGGVCGFYSSSETEKALAPEDFVERSHRFPGLDICVREFAFHELNANLLWPGTFAFAEWLVQHGSLLEGRRTVELGSGTGALAIFLRKAFGLDVTTSDYDDVEIEDNISHNCMINGIAPVLPHIRHSWGEPFPVPDPDWDLVIASDILLYVKQYGKLIKTLCFLLKRFKPKSNGAAPVETNPHDSPGEQLPSPAFLMSWRRRIGKEDESLFFDGCEDAGLHVKHLGSRVYCIWPKELWCAAHEEPGYYGKP
ncbi:hypothetical protein MLD38_029958 [Melastoma candidum]|uniref:Uncharacterized protein n=1 Tax=Melastoma candidum TaxID=119954 RepID=A0ACB9MQF6_9MYRT|nr:hypothetical protein MLD38_029958 [Melastoma candidum]